uniref:Putative secreted protein n=1 Tax=Anopheles darlingi TaxID=43151 RepID=A0A2M4DEP6_ANODA
MGSRAVWSRLLLLLLPLLLAVSALPRMRPSFRPSVAVATTAALQHPPSVRSMLRQMFAIPPLSGCFPFRWTPMLTLAVLGCWSWPRW